METVTYQQLKERHPCPETLRDFAKVFGRKNPVKLTKTNLLKWEAYFKKRNQKRIRCI